MKYNTAIGKFTGSNLTEEHHVIPLGDWIQARVEL